MLSEPKALNLARAPAVMLLTGPVSKTFDWPRGAPLRAGHHDRLVTAGVDPNELAALDLREVTGPLPDWWAASNNTLYLHAGINPPKKLIKHLTHYAFRDALIVLASPLDVLHALMVGGRRATIFVGTDCWMSHTDIFCGANSSVVLQGRVIATGHASVDARNGGSVVAGRDQLWAAHAYIATDDMHRVEDVTTGDRINPYGASIRLGEHVWLGRDAIVTGDSTVGDGAIVGMRALVRHQTVDAQTAVGGVPARVLRKNVTWSADDTP